MGQRTGDLPGWDEDRVHRIITHCEQQSKGEAVAQDCPFMPILPVP
jgi:hypothetical protein